MSYPHSTNTVTWHTYLIAGPPAWLRSQREKSLLPSACRCHASCMHNDVSLFCPLTLVTSPGSHAVTTGTSIYAGGYILEQNAMHPQSSQSAMSSILVDLLQPLSVCVLDTVQCSSAGSCRYYCHILHPFSWIASTVADIYIN